MQHKKTDEAETDPLPKMLGYLNFSGGAPDAQFRSGLNALAEQWGDSFTVLRVCELLANRLTELEGTSAAFEDVTQARTVIKLTGEFVFPAYIQFHSDLLAHLTPQQFEQPFLLARMFEAALGTEIEGDLAAVAERVIVQLNDYLGYRPVAVLENGREMQPWPHEGFCPVPLYFEESGVAAGPYQKLITAVLQHVEWMRERAPDLFELAHFIPDRLDELALDHRAHDHNHPVNKRTNYMFGEWDPHRINNQGFYTRFIVRQIILDALMHWIGETTDLPEEERIYDAAAVLTGTLLMASAISGSGPDSHMSGTSLGTLLPVVAGLRDDYYNTLLELLEGERKERLTAIAHLTQQPFGHVRQGLNIFLAGYGAMQLQLRELALIFARMGYPEAAEKKAREIPCLATRFETDLQTRLSLADRHQANGQIEPASQILGEIRSLFHRGIDCGALIDPWNILGFQGQFPLFQSREDVFYDQRAEVLLDLMGQYFDICTLALGEAAASGQNGIAMKLSKEFEEFATEWDRYATSTVHDLPEVRGEQSWEAAGEVARILTRWRAAGEAAGDVSFWRENISDLSSAQALRFVVEKLLQKEDLVSSMALLMQWLNLADEAELPEVHPLLLRWLGMAVRTTRGRDPEELRGHIRRLFDYTEANAEEFWSVPTLSSTPVESGLEDDDLFGDDPHFDSSYDDEEENIFGAAYDQVVFRDSADDGIEGETADSGGSSFNTEFDIIARTIEPRLHFLQTVAQLWQMAGMGLAIRVREANQPHPEEYVGRLKQWQKHVHKTQREISRLISELNLHEISSDYTSDSGMEYDTQLQRKLQLMHQAVNTHVSFRAAERALLCNLNESETEGKITQEQLAVVQRMRSLLVEDYEDVQQSLPRLLKSFVGRPLLYIPLENGGDPQVVQDARNRQAILQFLIGGLARCGLLKESWHVLHTAQKMERVSRPKGIAVTEFDRLFGTALRSVLETVLRSIKTWDEIPPEDVVTIIGQVLVPYKKMWERHAKTMRLSSVETIAMTSGWDEMREFIETYGGDLLHARDLTLGHLRAVLHSGVPEYLDFLEKNEDPLHPIRLLEDIRNGELDPGDAIERLETIYMVIVDQFDRFLEYNSTTTHSDYGNRLFCLMELLAVETAYDRDAWVLTPDHIAHEMLSSEGFGDAAWLWEDDIRERTRESAEGHLDSLSDLEKKYGVLLPSLRNHLAERFVKSLAVNRMTSHVSAAMKDSSNPQSRAESAAFDALLAEANAYLETASGSGIDVPAWLRNLGHEVSEEEQERLSLRLTSDLNLPIRSVSREDLARQLQTWTRLTPNSADVADSEVDDEGGEESSGAE